MPGAGTDKTKNWVQQPGPVVILVEPQLGENIGSAARAMANFGLGRLRLVKPAFASLNLAQAVINVAYEWFKLTGPGLPFSQRVGSPQASKQQLLAFFRSLEGELEKVEFFRPPAKRHTMQLNLRNIFTRMALSQQDIRTLHGVIM